MMNTITLRYQKTATIAMTLLFWAVAAILVVGAHRVLESTSPAGAAFVKILAILAVAFAYMRLTRREVTIDEAMFVGIAWATLAMIAEVYASSHLGRGWFVLIGSPSHEALRNSLLIAWVGAPALFARRRE